MTDLPELSQVLARLKAQGLVPTPDPVQVQRKADAFLLALGTHLAQDLDVILPISEDELRELGRLHCMAENPTLTPGLAVVLERVAAERAGTWDGTTYSPWPRTAPAPGAVNDSASGQGGAQGGVSITPADPIPSDPSGQDPGRGGTHTRASRRTPRRKPDVLDEAMDKIHFPEEDE